jgi:hypothetical protein
MNTLTENALQEIHGGIPPGETPWINPVEKVWWEFWLRNHAQ